MTSLGIVVVVSLAVGIQALVGIGYIVGIEVGAAVIRVKVVAAAGGGRGAMWW